MGIRIYAFAGENSANYSGLVAQKESMLSATTFIFDQLIKKHKHLLFSFHGLLESKVSTKILEQYFVERQLPPSIFRVVTPYIDFHDIDFHIYFHQCSKKHDMNYRERMLRNVGSLIKITPSQDELSEMFKILDRRWTKRLDTGAYRKGKKSEIF